MITLQKKKERENETSEKREFDAKLKQLNEFNEKRFSLMLNNSFSDKERVVWGLLKVGWLLKWKMAVF